MFVSIITVNLSLATWAPVLSFLGRGVVFVVSMELHLRLATNIEARRRLLFELLVLVVMFIYPIYKQVGAASKFRPFAPYSSTLLPPALQFYSTTSTDEFMARAAQTLEAARLLVIEKRSALVDAASAEPEPGQDPPVEEPTE